MNKKKFLIGSITGLGMLLVTIAPALAVSPVVVNPSNMHGWAFFDDNGKGGSGSLVSGPGTPPLGTGSAQIGLTSSDQGYAFGNGGFGGLKLSDITSLSYSTYVQKGNNTEAPALQLNIDSDLTDNNTSWQGRLVYEPYYTHSVVDGQWQTWNTQDNATNGTNGNWWFSNSTLALNTGCSQATPCTWSQVLSKIPNGGISTSNPGIIFKAGSNWVVPFTGNIDAFTIGNNGVNTTYDFEPMPNVTVTIAKYLDGSLATATSANNASFPMTASWNATNLGTGTGNYTLGPTGYNNPNSYQATTSEMASGASYSTSEVTNNINNSSHVLPIGAACQTGYTRLVGYSTGDTLADAENASTTATSPDFTNVTTNKYVIVRNESCTTPPTNFAQCKGNGWKTFNNPPFKNEGLCVAYVSRHQHHVNGSITYTANSLVRHGIFAMNTAINSGVFFYWDANHNWYSVKVSDVNVSGNTAWFAGKVTNANQHAWVGQWLFTKVTDNSPDMIWGSFTDQTSAMNGVTTMTDPADGPFTVTSGNLSVH